tara:strand:+ start:1310 stop:1888 length:579 start_codon:yes stop_codon:yes gene_type:complete
MIYLVKNKNSINKAVEILKSGGVIIYPTDTLYGFGADATNTKAINKLNLLKNRKDPLSIIVHSLNEIEKYGKLGDDEKAICKRIFPGAFTILIESIDSNLSPLVNETSNYTGIRIPNHPFPIEVTKHLGNPIVTTSVNKKGQPSLSDTSEMKKVFPDTDIFKDKINHSSKGSTIINLAVSPHKIIRNGDGKL